MLPSSAWSYPCTNAHVKYLGLVGNYGHLSHSPLEWQPVPFDRCINVDCEFFEGEVNRSCSESVVD